MLMLEREVKSHCDLSMIDQCWQRGSYVYVFPICYDAVLKRLQEKFIVTGYKMKFMIVVKGRKCT